MKADLSTSANARPIILKTGWDFWLQLAFAGIVALIAALPTWVNADSSYGFEPDKSWALLLLAGAGLAACAAQTLTHGSAEVRGLLFRNPLWLSLPVLLMPAAAITSASLSLHPAWAWWGSPHRSFGLWIQIMGWACVFIMLVLPRHLRLEELIGRTLIASSIPVTIIALYQWTGGNLPSLLRGDLFDGRPFSTLGNPVFLAHYLLFVIPFIFVELCQSNTDSHPAFVKVVLGKFALSTLLIAQVVILAACRSRGAWAGMAISGATAIGIIGRSIGSRRWLFAGRWAMIATALLFLTVPFLVRDGTTAGHMLDPTGSGHQRIRLWEQTLRAWWKDVPLSRRLIGFGQESQGWWFATYLASPTFAHSAAQENSLFDRGHNVLLDVLLTQGIVGIASRLFLATAVVWSGLRDLRSVVRFNSLALAALTGTIVFPLAVWVATRQVSFAVPAAGLGALMGWMGVNVWGKDKDSAKKHHVDAAGLSPSNCYTVAYLTALAGHWVALQFSFETITTHFLACIIAALALRRGLETVHSAYRDQGLGMREASRSEGYGFSLACGISLAGLGMSAAPTVTGDMLWMLAGAWMACGLFCGMWYGRRAVRFYPALSLAPVIVIGGGLSIRQMVDDPTGWSVVVPTLAGWSALILGAGLGAWLMARDAATDGMRVPVFSLIFVLIVWTGMAIVPARLAAGDLLTRQGQALAIEGRLDEAEIVLHRAVAWGALDSSSLYTLAQISLVRAMAADTKDIARENYRLAIELALLARNHSPLQKIYSQQIGTIATQWIASERADDPQKKSSLAALQSFIATNLTAPVSMRRATEFLMCHLTLPLRDGS